MYKCKKCEKDICTLCHYDSQNKDIKELTYKLPKDKASADNIFRLIPSLGTVTSKLIPESRLIVFIKAETSKSIYLL